MKKLFSLFGSFITFTKRGNPLKEGFAPYADPSCNRLYNELFCDKLELLRTEAGDNPQGVWLTLLAKEPSAASLKTVAEDSSQESRARALAYNRLRDLKEPVPAEKLLGVVVEVALHEGFEVLAAYPDGRVCYINSQEKRAVFDSVPAAWLPSIRSLMTAAQTAVERIGPWEQPRVAPPTTGMIRMSFLVSDGLYFGQGLLDVMEQDKIASPIIAASKDLLQLVMQTSPAA